MGSFGDSGWPHNWMTVVIEPVTWFDEYQDETEEAKRIRESRQHGPQKKKGKGKVKRW